MFKTVNKLSIGTAQFGMPYGIANQNGQVSEMGARSILDLAYENEINTLDTAKDYGKSEASIGNYLKQTKNSWDIITKVSSANNVIEQIQDSRKKLTVKPTVVLAHSANLFIDPVFQLELQEAKDNELIGSIGVSLYNEKEIDQVLESDLKPKIIQLPMNILDTRLYRHGVLDKLSEKGIEIHVRSAFLQGLFYLDESELNRQFSNAIPYLIKLQSIATKANLTLAELSLLWLIGLEQVSKVVIGVDNASQLKSHLKTLKKNVDDYILEEALNIHYENENVLNPSLWT